MASNLMSAQDGAIRQGAEATKQARTDLAQRITAVESHVQALGSRFQGVAATQFNSLMDRWHAESKQITDALDGFESNLLKQQSHLESGEQEQSSAFAKIASRLGGN